MIAMPSHDASQPPSQADETLDRSAFYARCAAILHLPFSLAPRPQRLTRWNNRHPGNGRFAGYGTIRAFSPRLIHLAFHSPTQQVKTFTSQQAVYDHLEALRSTEMNDIANPHPARALPYDTLMAQLNAAIAAGLVQRRTPSAEDPAALQGLSLYVYSIACVYQKAWDATTTLARGLIIDEAAKQIVATGFPKFFNLGEYENKAHQNVVPDLPFEIFEKVDGSLIILFHYQGQWQCASKGGFGSPQTGWARNWLKTQDLSSLVPGVTYLAEAIYPDNKIVVRYTTSELVLLAAYDQAGHELSYEAVLACAQKLGWRTAQRLAYQSLQDLLNDAATMPISMEGAVIRFANGLRMKVKGASYRRTHAQIARCTPLLIFESMIAEQDMAAIRRDLPEELWGDYDRIIGLLNDQVEALVEEIKTLAKSVDHLSDKELGLSLKSLPPHLRNYLFSLRKCGINQAMRLDILKKCRPTQNQLAGYTPSYDMKRIMRELEE